MVTIKQYTKQFGSVTRSLAALLFLAILAVVATPLLVNGQSGQTTLSSDSTVSGDLTVEGALSKGGGSFVIDHPLDPANKLLYHSFVESPDVKNIYDGIIELDGDGEAIVRLPKYYEAVNGNSHYLLTPIGGPAPDLYVKSGVNNNRFVIAGGEPGQKISWQVTGIRHDPYIEAYPIEVEVEKNEESRGSYLFPELYVE